MVDFNPPFMEDTIDHLKHLKGISPIIDRSIIEIERHLYVIEQEFLREEDLESS